MTLGSEHIMQFIDDVLQSCTLETCIILLTNITLINLKRLKEKTIVNFLRCDNGTVVMEKIFTRVCMCHILVKHIKELSNFLVNKD